MVRFNRSMNDVFNVEESSELLSASSNRHAAPCSALRSTLMMRPFLRVLRCPFHKLELCEISELPATRMLGSSSCRTFRGSASALLRGISVS